MIPVYKTSEKLSARLHGKTLERYSFSVRDGDELRRYARSRKIDTKQSSQGMLDGLFGPQDKPTRKRIPRLLLRRSLRAPVLEGHIFRKYHIDDQRKLKIEAQFKDKTYNPHKNLIADTARVVVRGNLGPDDERPTLPVHPASPPDRNRLLLRQAALSRAVPAAGPSNNAAPGEPGPSRLAATSVVATHDEPTPQRGAGGAGGAGAQDNQPTQGHILLRPRDGGEPPSDDSDSDAGDSPDENAPPPPPPNPLRRGNIPALQEYPGWLEEMMSDLRNQRQALKWRLKETRVELAEAIAQLVLVRTNLEMERAEYDNLESQIEQVAGPKFIAELREMAKNMAFVDDEQNDDTDVDRDDESVASCDAPPDLQNMPSISTRLHKRAREEHDDGEEDGAFEHGTSEQDDFADVSHAPRRNRIKRIRHDDDVPPATQPSPTPNKRVHRPLPQTSARGKGKGKAREDYDDADDVRSHYRHIPQPSVRNNGKGKAREVGSDDYSDADDERPRPRPVIQTPVRNNGKRKAHAVEFDDDDADDERPRRKYPRTPRYSAHEVAHNASVPLRLLALPRTPLHGERRRHSGAVPSYDPYVAPLSGSRPGPMLPPGMGLGRFGMIPDRSLQGEDPLPILAPQPRRRTMAFGFAYEDIISVPGSVPPLNPYLPPSSSQSSDAPFAGTSIWGLRDGVADHEDGGDARSSASDAQRPVLYRAPLLRGDRWHGHIPAEHGPERLLPSPPRPGGGDMNRGLEEPIDPRYDACRPSSAIS